MNDDSNHDGRRTWNELLQRHFTAMIALVGSERDAYLQKVSAGDPELGRKLDLLISHHEGSPENAPRTDRAKVDSVSTERWIGRMVGDVLIQSEIGVGGMGTVFMGTQNAPRRTVAVQVRGRGGGG